MINFKFVLVALVSLTCIMTNSVMAETIFDIFKKQDVSTEQPALSPTLEIDIPYMTYTTPKVSFELWTKLDYSHSSDDKLYWVLSEFGKVSDEVSKGKRIYKNTCALCHKIGGSSSISSSDPKRIRAAMLTNTGGMGSLSYLDDTDLEYIAEYIETTISSTPSDPVDMGKSIYDESCLACHAVGSSAWETSIFPNAVRAAILTDTGGMSKLSYLSDSDLEAIADYIEQ